MIVDPSSNNVNSSILSRFGGLASVAGISIPSSSGGKKSNLAEETIKSRDFFSQLIKDNDILHDLYAAKNYDKKSKKIIYDEKYNEEKSTWNISNKNVSLKPSEQEAYIVYRSMLGIAVSDKSGYMTLSITHVSPEFAGTLIDLIVDKVNSITRQNDLIESDTALKYLKSMIGTVSNNETKDSLTNLIEAQLETQMLVNIREDDYLLRYIDKPFSPEKKYSPRRSLYVILSTLLGALFAILFVIYRDINKTPYKL
tara:strand:- start:21 stop:785 length:765 start_codon:yes stop_codon:yes gene_type:complete